MNSAFKENLKKLCLIDGVSGDEGAVRDEIIAQIKDYCEYTVDNLGSIIAFKKGEKTPAKKVALAAHLDEVGFIITAITDDGLLKFAPVGGIDVSVIIGRRLRVGRERLLGVVGAKPVHLLDAEAREKLPDIESLYIDIGAKDKEEAAEYVSLGDMAAFEGEYIEFGESMLSCKAIDDRVGCAALIELIKKPAEYDFTCVFTAREEIGTIGAIGAAHTLGADVVIVVETTTTADMPPAEGEKMVCKIGEGAVVSYMDRGTLYDRELFALAFKTAEKYNIKIQTKTGVFGGNDSRSFQTGAGGARVMAISVPCRNLHSQANVCSYNDINSVSELAGAVLREVILA